MQTRNFNKRIQSLARNDETGILKVLPSPRNPGKGFKPRRYVRNLFKMLILSATQKHT